jgi:hypothetical protein
MPHGPSRLPMGRCCTAIGNSKPSRRRPDHSSGAAALLVDHDVTSRREVQDVANLSLGKPRALRRSVRRWHVEALEHRLGAGKSLVWRTLGIPSSK